MSTTATQRMPVMFLTHGGGPMPLLQTEPTNTALAKNWATYAQKHIPTTPKAIILVSAHYETTSLAVGGAERPKMIYDYGGFPSEAYSVRYDAPGSPALTEKVSALMAAAGVKCTVDPSRGFDHGVFVPLTFLYPNANIPVVPLSVLRNQNAAEHIRIGQALAPLRNEGVLIVGSGSSYHNLGDMFGNNFARMAQANEPFEHGLNELLTDACMSNDERLKALARWEQDLPFADGCHPPGAREHFLPLLTVAGAASGTQAQRSFVGRMMTAMVSEFVWL